MDDSGSTGRGNGPNRREAVTGALALALVGRAANAAEATTPDTAHAALLQRFATAFLRRSPEEASAFGFDTGGDADLRARLDDRSLAARASDRSAIAAAQRLLAAVDVAALGPAARLDHQVAVFVCTTLADLLARPGYIDINLRPSPYVVNQMNGAYYWLPDLIGSRQPLATNADMEAWLARLAALAVALDQETDRITHDAALGVIPPDFVIQRTMVQLQALRDTPALATAMIAPALVRARAAGLPVRADAAETLFRTRIAPALDRQIAALRALLPRAVTTAGVWRLPDGAAYYAAALRANTTTDSDPETLHRLGLAQCAELRARIDTLLRAEGLHTGTLAERMAALDRDARFRVAADDAGRARLLAAAEAAIARVTARLPRAFGNTHVAPLTVQRMPVAIEAGSPGAFYNGGSGGQPGSVLLNLGNPAEHPLWRLPTLVHHEAVPGHHFQASVLDSVGDLPLFRRIVRFSAWTEGWGLYAQQVADELGVFDDDPCGRIGALQSQLFRAARIVVDTGLHHRRWTRDEAVAWMVENAGEQPEATAREVARYCVYPGQACSFKVGADRILAARHAAMAALGPRFRVQDFHDLVLESGPVPLAVLEAGVAAWSGR
ncbi:MAG: hypothetical protein RL490_872 [Pseudomonadota bacterium]